MNYFAEFFIPVFKVEDTEREIPFAEISFNAQLVSSNNNGRVTPLEVCELGMLSVHYPYLPNAYFFQ